MRKRLAGAALSAVMVIGGAAFAQQQGQRTPNADGTQPAPREGKRFGGRHGREGGEMRRGGRMGHGGIGMLRGLNLTEAQQQQVRTIMEKYHAQNKPQMEEARNLMMQKRQGTLDAAGEARLKQMHEQFRASAQATHKAMQAELVALLTPEQKAILEQRRQQEVQRLRERLQEVESQRYN